MFEVYDFLKKNNLNYEVVNHNAANTTELADKYIEGYEGIRTKSMFIYNKTKTNFYLLILNEDKKVDFQYLQTILGEKKLKFSSDIMLLEKLKLPPGTVSIFGLLNNKEHDVKVIFDKNIMNDLPLTFHPNINTATIFIRSEDILKYLKILHISYMILDLDKLNVKKEKSCGAVIYHQFESGIKFLLCEHIDGHYGFPKGHIEQNETEIECAIREIKEEVNLDIKINDEYKNRITYSPQENTIKEVVYYIANSKEKDVILQKNEIKRAKWANISEAQNIIYYKDELDVLMKSLDYINKGERK